MAKALSLKPEDMSTGGGGILADTNARWLKVSFGMETYRGKGPAAPAFMLDYLDLDQDKEFQQSWSVGHVDDYTPSKDGKQLLGDKPIKASSNFGMLLSSLASSIGSQEFNEHMGDDITVLAGMETHFFQILDERSTAKPRKDEKTGKEYPATIPVVDKVMVKPWDKKSGKSSVAASTGNEDVKAQAPDLIKQALTANPGGLDKQTLATQVFQLCDDINIKTAMVMLISNDEAFVSGIDGVVLENGVFKLG